MSKWREEDHPRGKDGKFVDKINAYLRSGRDIPLLPDGRLNIIAVSKAIGKMPFSIPLDFFANKGIAKQRTANLRKSIRTLTQRIDEHYEKIAHPERIYKEWYNFPEELKTRIILHWKKEIKNFQRNISECEEELNKRGERTDAK